MIKKLKQNKRKGFTLIELVVVIAIMAILALVMVPNLTAYVKKANMAKIDANMKNIHTAAEMVNKTERSLDVDKIKEYSNINDLEISDEFIDNTYTVHKNDEGKIVVKYTSGKTEKQQFPKGEIIEGSGSEEQPVENLSAKENFLLLLSSIANEVSESVATFVIDGENIECKFNPDNVLDYNDGFVAFFEGLYVSTNDVKVTFTLADGEPLYFEISDKAIALLESGPNNNSIVAIMGLWSSLWSEAAVVEDNSNITQSTTQYVATVIDLDGNEMQLNGNIVVKGKPLLSASVLRQDIQRLRLIDWD